MKRLTQKPYSIIWIASAFLCAVYFTLVFNNSVWTDEAYTSYLIKHNFLEIIQGTARDVHPPLYYLLAKIVYMVFHREGYFVIFQKILTIVPFFLTYGITGSWLWKKGFGAKAVFFFDLFLFATPCTMEYAVQIRMYSWGLFFVTMCGLLAYDVYTENEKNKWILLTLSAVASAYIHNFALVSVFFVYLLLGIMIAVSDKKRLLKWLVSGIGVFVLYFPWLIVLLKQFTRITDGKNYWIEPITLKTILSYFDWTFGNDFKYTVWIVTTIFLMTGIYSLYLIKHFHRSEDIYAQLCWLVPFLTMLFGVIVSVLTQPIYYNRYVFCSLGILFAGVGITLRNIDIKEPFIIALISCFVFVGAEQYRENYHQEYTYTTGAKEFTKFVKENDLGSRIYYNDGTLNVIYSHYLGDRLFPLQEAVFPVDENEWYYLYSVSSATYSPDFLTQNNISCEYVMDIHIEEAYCLLMRFYRE